MYLARSRGWGKKEISAPLCASCSQTQKILHSGDARSLAPVTQTRVTGLIRHQRDRFVFLCDVTRKKIYAEPQHKHSVDDSYT
jgi:hypothetical protein